MENTSRKNRERKYPNSVCKYETESLKRKTRTSYLSQSWTRPHINTDTFLTYFYYSRQLCREGSRIVTKKTLSHIKIEHIVHMYLSWKPNFPAAFELRTKHRTQTSLSEFPRTFFVNILCRINNSFIYYRLSYTFPFITNIRSKKIWL